LGFYQQQSSGGRIGYNVHHEDDPRHPVALTGGLLGSAFTTFQRSFFRRNVGNIAGNPDFHRLSTEDAQILVALHELGHATGAAAASHGDGWDAQREYNEAIYLSCIK
jgi:hypothetical protein